MEFQYRAGDARSPSTGAAATSANSESAATRVQSDYGGDGSGYHGQNSEAVAPRPASDLDELWRQAAKERIRERILREEAETLALEAEVWRELLKERIPSLRSQLTRSAGTCAKGSEARAEPAANSPSLKTPIGHEVGSKSGVSVALPGKRKAHHVAAASNVWAATSNKKQKSDLNCMVCGITATSEGALQEHLKGKSHGRKAAKLAPPLTGAGHHEVSSKVNGSAAWPAKGKDPNVASTVFASTSSNEQMPDLTCPVCGITSTSQKAMQDHLKGKHHKRKAAKHAQPMPKEDVVTNMVHSKPNASVAAALLPAKRKNSHVIAAESTISAAASSKKQKQDLTCTVCGITAMGEKGMQDHLKRKAHMRKAAALAQLLPEEAAEHGQQEETEEEGAYTPRKLNMLTNSGNMCEVMQMNGFLLCEVCDVKAADLVTMMCHLEGGKHISKAKQQEEHRKAVSAAVARGDPELETVAVNGVRRVDGYLLCEFCDVKVASEIVMRSHLSGKKHTSKQKAAIDAGAGGKAVLAQEEKTNKDVAVGTSVDITVTPGQQAKKADAAATVGVSNKLMVLNVGGQGNGESVEKPAVEKMEVVPSATPQEDGAAPVCASFSVAPMEVHERTDAGDDTAKAEEEKVDAKEEEAVETNGIAAVAGQEAKIQVEGKVFTVLRQADGSLSCGLCGQHGCDKDRMLEHLYTREHWRRASISEQKEEQAKKAAPAVVNNDSDGVVVPVIDGAAQVEN